MCVVRRVAAAVVAATVDEKWGCLPQGSPCAETKTHMQARLYTPTSGVSCFNGGLCPMFVCSYTFARWCASRTDDIECAKSTVHPPGRSERQSGSRTKLMYKNLQDTDRISYIMVPVRVPLQT